MQQIEFKDGYMVCVTCRGFIDAGIQIPVCECPEIELNSETIN